MKFIRIKREKNRHIYITCTFSLQLFNWVVGWIPLLLHWKIHQVLYMFHQGWNSSFLCCFFSIRSQVGDSIVVLLLNFGGILQQKACPTMEYAGLNIQNKKMYRCSTNMCPTKRAKNMFMLDFGSEHTKTQELLNARACQELIEFSN